MERLFIAIKIQEATQLTPLVRNTRVLMRKERMRWIPDNDLHITLKFLGKVDTKIISKLKLAIDKAVRDYNDFPIQLKGLGNFGSRVLFAGVENNPELVILQQRLEEALLPFFPKEEKEFIPHITLARINHLDNKSQFFKIIDANRNCLLDTLEIENICLMKSELRVVGPVYSVVETFPLQVPEKVDC